MGDFLASYYDSSNFTGSELDEKVISQHMALLKTEQPVSILEMEHLDDPIDRLPTRLREVNALPHSAPVTMDNDTSVDDRNALEFGDEGWEDDLEIPVASMSTFEQGMPSMVSVQLFSGKGDELNGKGRRQIPPPPPLRRRLDRVMEPELEYDVCSPLSAAKLVQAQMRPRRRMTLDVVRNEEKKREESEELCMEVDYNEILKCEERAARQVAQMEKLNFKNSLFRFLGRRGKK